MKNEIRSLYRRFFYNDAREPTTPEGDLLTKIIPLVSALLLAADSIRRYLEIIAPSEVLKYSQHFLLAVTIVSLLYIATRVRPITPAKTESTSPIIEFAYQRKWRNFAKFSILPILALYVWGLWQAPEPAIRFAAQVPLTVNATSSPTNAIAHDLLIQTSSYHANVIAYDLLVQNTGTTQQILTELGVHSDFEQICIPVTSPETGAIPVAANYAIEFDVDQPETTIRMDPPLAIQPNDVVRFTVSLIPVIRVGCGMSWKSQVTVFVTNADGESIETEPRTITGEDFLNLVAHDFSFEEIIDIAANSSYENSRVVALSRLHEYRTSQNEEQIVMLLIKSLESTSPEVRSASITALAEFGDRSDVVQALGTSAMTDSDTGVRVAAVYSLGSISSPQATDVLKMIASSEQDPTTKSAAQEELRKLGK